ncbi:unnamed protein product [Vicia faba]|uniref:Uncharacterized protein n=1 Tax=Vicia faba TaxID=3906 RepID=A0AAV1B082_VICFA|nr:unnamed protein product [Vicia faba]
MHKRRYRLTSQHLRLQPQLDSRPPIQSKHPFSITSSSFTTSHPSDVPSKREFDETASVTFAPPALVKSRPQTDSQPSTCSRTTNAQPAPSVTQKNTTPEKLRLTTASPTKPKLKPDD